jgi:hypothetical protein
MLMTSALFSVVMWRRVVIRDNLSVPFSWVKKTKTLEDATDRLSRNVGIIIPLYAA